MYASDDLRFVKNFFARENFATFKLVPRFVQSPLTKIDRKQQRNTMSRSRILLVIVSFLTLSALFGIASSLILNSVQAQDADKTSDPVQAALDEYRKPWSSGLSYEEKLPKYEEWRDLLLARARAYPESPARRLALYEALYLCNNLSDQDAAFALLDELLLPEDLTIYEKQELKNEYAEIARNKFWKTRKVEDGLFAIKLFDESNALLETLLSDSTKSQSERTTSSASGTNTGKTYYAEQQMLNCAWAGQVAFRLDDSEDAARQAAAYFQQARALLSALGEPTGRAAGLNYDHEYLLSSEASAWAKANDLEKMESALEELKSTPNKRLTAAAYLEIIVKDVFLSQDAFPRSFLQSWLESHADDPEASLIAYALAMDLIREYPQEREENRQAREKEREEALSYFISLVDGQYAEELMQIEAETIKKGTGGRYAIALFCLTTIYLDKQDYLKAQEYKERFLKMFPNNKASSVFAESRRPCLQTQCEIQEAAESISD